MKDITIQDILSKAYDIARKNNNSSTMVSIVMLMQQNNIHTLKKVQYASSISTHIYPTYSHDDSHHYDHYAPEIILAVQL